MITFNGDKKHIKGSTKQIKEVINCIAKDHGYKINQIDYVFVDDEKLLEINKAVLKHDYYTDIISFDYTEGKNIEGEIYISIDRVKDNATKYKTEFHVELLRVIFHGVLHYVGYKDKSKKAALVMREQEETYLKIYKEKFHVEL
ncbi:MAG: rRNA maturation RNase YbeY [Chitinophagaceae bacterium]